MTTLHPTTQLLDSWNEPIAPEEAELAAVAFLARYSGRTLDAYRHDLRNLFQWAADHGLAVLEATRAHLEMYRSSMEERGLAAATIDRRLSTACGFYRFAHIDGRISSNPAQYVRRPTVHPTERRGLDRGEFGEGRLACGSGPEDDDPLHTLIVSEAAGSMLQGRSRSGPSQNDGAPGRLSTPILPVGCV